MSKTLTPINPANVKGLVVETNRFDWIEKVKSFSSRNASFENVEETGEIVVRTHNGDFAVITFAQVWR